MFEKMKKYSLKIGSSSFWWDSKLTTERKSEIIEWVNGLDYKHRAMIRDLMRDAFSEGEESGIGEF